MYQKSDTSSREARKKEDGIAWFSSDKERRSEEDEGRDEEKVEEEGKVSSLRLTMKGIFCCARAITGRYHSGTGDFVQWQEG